MVTAPTRRARFRFDRALLAVLGVALVLRIAAVVWLADTVPYSDYFYYHEAGRLAAGDPGFFFRTETVDRYAKLSWWPPGYPMFLAALYSLVGPQHRVAVGVQVVLGVAVCALVYAIGRRAAGRKAGLVAAVLLALSPSYVFTTNLLASENLFAPLFATGLWLVGGKRRPLAAGVVLALGALVRAVGLFAPVTAALWLRQRGSRRGALLLVAGCALSLLPWTIRNAAVAGSPALVCFGGGLNFWYGHNDGPIGYREIRETPFAGTRNAAVIDREAWRQGLEYIAAEPVGVLTRGVRKLGALFAPPTGLLHANSAIEIPVDPAAAGERRARQAVKDRWLHGPIAKVAAVHAYALLGLALVAIVLGRRRLPDELQLATWMLAGFLVSYLVFWAQPRFRYPMEIPAALLAGWVIAGRREP